MRRLTPILALMALAGAACTGSGNDHRPTPSPIPAVNATTAPLLPTTVNALPDVTFAQFRELLSQLKGTPVVVNVWGSWCGPCREEGPRLASAARSYGTRVQFLGLDVKDSRGPAQAFIGDMGWTYPSVFDPSSDADVERQLGYFAQPVTLFYGRDGKLADQVSGPVSSDALAAGIRTILG